MQDHVALLLYLKGLKSKSFYGCELSYNLYLCRFKVENSEKLQNEYSKLVQGLLEESHARSDKKILSNPSIYFIIDSRSHHTSLTR